MGLRFGCNVCGGFRFQGLLILGFETCILLAALGFYVMYFFGLCYSFWAGYAESFLLLLVYFDYVCCLPFRFPGAVVSGFLGFGMRLWVA